MKKLCCVALGALLSVASATLHASNYLDPAKVVGPGACGECHTKEVEAWEKTHHAKTFDTMHRSDEARAIAEKMGIRRIKSESLCMNCHYTPQISAEGKVSAIAGTSCESCHGEAKDWIEVHNFYGEGATKETETVEHKAERLKKSLLAGMLNPDDTYSVASNCFQCHLVPNEKLVNVGGHTAGSKSFELVAWSHGEVRHNFHQTDGKSNQESSQEHKRELFVIGLILDLENSLRGTAIATEKGPYGITMAKRAAKVLAKLTQLNGIAPTPEVGAILEAVSKKMLKLNNKDELLAVADQVAVQGKAFAKNGTGKSLAALDKYIAKPAKYKGDIYTVAE